MRIELVKIYLIIIFWSKVFRIKFIQCLSEIINDLGHIIYINNADIIIYVVIVSSFSHINC